MFKATLDQWLLLHTVVELGSIAKAAAFHHRTQPAVSYQLNQLQERLGITLLMLEGRRLVLTDIGRSLLDQATTLLDGFRDLELKASSYQTGQRTSISLVIDVTYPKHQLFTGLKRFNEVYPQIQVHVKETIKDEGLMQVEQETGDLYFIFLPDDVKLEKQLVMNIRFLLVAHRDHQIFHDNRNVLQTQLSNVPLIQVVDKENQEKAKQNQQKSWYFTSIGSAKDAVLNQLGYGWLPEKEIRHYLKKGILRPITDGYDKVRVSSLYYVCSKESRYDQIIKALADILLNPMDSKKHNKKINTL